MSGKATASVYWAIAGDGSWIYIGRSSRLRRRLGEHRYGADWAHLVATWWATRPMRLRYALDLEALMIAAHRPPFNTQGNPDYEPGWLLGDALKGIPQHVMDILDAAVQYARPIASEVAA